MPRPWHFSWFHHPNNVRRGAGLHIIKLLLMLSSALPCHLVPLRSNYLPYNLFSNTFSVCYSLNVRDQASHPVQNERQKL
jgi:hypothetical protein